MNPSRFWLASLVVCVVIVLGMAQVTNWWPLLAIGCCPVLWFLAYTLDVLQEKVPRPRPKHRARTLTERELKDR